MRGGGRGGEESSTVRSDNDESKPFVLDNGVLQGSPLSPLLYIIFIDPLAHELASLNIGVRLGAERINSLFYADDIVLLAETAADMQLLLNVAERAAKRLRFRFNTKKCVAMRTKVRLQN
jgi:hypothetical protein